MASGADIGSGADVDSDVGACESTGSAVGDGGGNAEAVVEGVDSFSLVLLLSPCIVMITFWEFVDSDSFSNLATAV